MSSCRCLTPVWVKWWWASCGMFELSSLSRRGYLVKLNMADDELAAIRAKRMQELQAQYGVSSVKNKKFHFSQ